MRTRQSGQAMIELALTLPFLVMLMMGIVDFSRAIQFDNVLTSMSREGANLASRTAEEPDKMNNIITALTSTAEPLSMSTRGMVYITRIRGRADGSGEVEGQFRAAAGSRAIASKIWSCGSWRGDNSCVVPSPAPVVRLQMTLRAGETVYVSETAYQYEMLTGFLFGTAPTLHSMTIL